MCQCDKGHYGECVSVTRDITVCQCDKGHYGECVSVTRGTTVSVSV